jgi:septal ring factor EnvC (AmiA/AmiB activator)
MRCVIEAFNLLGVLVLAVLCVIQWQVNSRVNQRADKLDATRIEQAEKLDDDDRTIKGQAIDLEEFRQRITLAETQLKDNEVKLNQMTFERNQLSQQRDQYKFALSKWIAAVGERDAAIRKASVEIQNLARQRNDAIAQMNDLVVKYNALAKASN